MDIRFNILLLACLLMMQAAGVLGQEMVTAAAEQGEFVDPGNGSIPISVQVVPAGGLSLPAEMIPIESEVQANEQPDGEYDRSNPLINEELIVEGDQNGADIVEEETVVEADQASDSFRGLDDKTAGVTGSSAADKSQSDQTVQIVPNPVDDGTKQQPNPALSNTASGNGNQQGVDNPAGNNETTTATTVAGDSTKAELFDQLEEKTTQRESIPALWFVLGLLVVLDFVLIVSYTTIQSRSQSRKQVVQLPPPPIGNVSLQRPAGGWNQPEPLPDEA